METFILRLFIDNSVSLRDSRIRKGVVIMRASGVRVRVFLCLNLDVEGILLCWRGESGCHFGVAVWMLLHY